MNPTCIDARAPVARPPERRRERPRAETKPETWAWWLWPHLLSLDAPLVALVWQRWWAHLLGLVLPASHELILGLSVWMIYLADRLADTWDGQGQGAARHRFSRRFRRVLLPTTSGIAAALTILALICLPGAEFGYGLSLLALAVGYFWLIHGWPGRGWRRVWPKEAAVGAMFGAGTVFFIACRATHYPAAFWASNGFFVVVCFLNCALITSWERHEVDLHESSSLLNAFPRFSVHLRIACVLLAVAALVFATATRSWSTVPVAASAVLLAGLDGCAPRMSADALRLLADAVLLTPLIGLAL